MTDFDTDALADQVLPLGGPCTPEALAAAAGLAAELVRRLCRATRAGTPGITQPDDIDTLVGRLAGTVADLPQVLRQLAGHLAEFSDHPDLYADALAQGRPAPQVAGFAAGCLHQAAGMLADAGGELREARNETARLGIQTAEED